MKKIKFNRNHVAIGLTCLGSIGVIATTVLAAKQLEQNGLLRMDDYLGEELDNNYITTAFVLSNRKSKEES